MAGLLFALCGQLLFRDGNFQFRQYVIKIKTRFGFFGDGFFRFGRCVDLLLLDFAHILQGFLDDFGEGVLLAGFLVIVQIDQEGNK